MFRLKFILVLFFVSCFVQLLLRSCLPKMDFLLGAFYSTCEELPHQTTFFIFVYFIHMIVLLTMNRYKYQHRYSIPNHSTHRSIQNSTKHHRRSYSKIHKILNLKLDNNLYRKMRLSYLIILNLK